jgi:hypothetical protein
MRSPDMPLTLCPSYAEAISVAATHLESFAALRHIIRCPGMLAIDILSRPSFNDSPSSNYQLLLQYGLLL